MEDKIQVKIEEIVDHIISKPAADITLNDFTILHEEIKDIRFRKSQEESTDRFKQLMVAAYPSVGSFGSRAE